MTWKRNGAAMLLAPFNPVPAAVNMVEQLDRFEKLDPKIQEAMSLAEEHFTHVDERTLGEYVGPLLWTWARTALTPVLPAPSPPPLPPPGGPGIPSWEGWLLYLMVTLGPDWAMSPLMVIDGHLVLHGTHILLDGALAHASIEELGNEVARWSRSTTRNADRLSSAHDEFRYFLNECSKLQVERKSGICELVTCVGTLIGHARR
jgi:hypothetical protein